MNYVVTPKSGPLLPSICISLIQQIKGTVSSWGFQGRLWNVQDGCWAVVLLALGCDDVQLISTN